MGVLFEYFAATSDEQAASVIDRPGGPGAPDASAQAFDTVSAKDIDPVVQLGTLEELLTGRPYDDIDADPRCGHSLAVRAGGERLVGTLTDNVINALAAATPDRLAEVAVPWSQTEEFWGSGDPEILADFLQDLAALAARAQTSGQRVYCWTCV